MTRVVPGQRGNYVSFGRSVVEAVEAAAELLAADLRFEYLDAPRDELWRLVDQSQLDRQADHVNRFIDEHAQSPFISVCRVEIDYLTVDQPVDIFGIQLTPADALPAVRRNVPGLGAHSGCMAEVEVSGTSPERMMERARYRVQRVLRILRVAFLGRYSFHIGQLRFRVGAVAELDNGAGEWRAMDTRTGTLQAIRPLIDAVREHPTARLVDEPASDIERKADVALRWIDRAVFTDDPLVALLYQFFALEALLGDKSSGLKGEQLAFRRAMLSHVVTGGFRHPETALWLYDEVRNNAVHGENMPEVDSGAVKGFASDVRAALSEYLTFAQSEGLTRRSKLTRALDQHSDRQQLVAWLSESGGPRWERFVAEQTTASTAKATPG